MKSWIPIALALAATTLPSVSALAEDLTPVNLDAAGLIAALEAGGVKAKKVKGKKTVTVAISKLDCEMHSNNAIDPSDPSAAIADQTCTGVANGKKITLHETQWLIDALGKVGMQPDCAMSHCSLQADLILCTIDTSVQDLGNGKRFRCTIKNGE